MSHHKSVNQLDLDIYISQIKSHTQLRVSMVSEMILIILMISFNIIIHSVNYC